MVDSPSSSTEERIIFIGSHDFTEGHLRLLCFANALRQRSVPVRFVGTAGSHVFRWRGFRFFACSWLPTRRESFSADVAQSWEEALGDLRGKIAVVAPETGPVPPARELSLRFGSVYSTQPTQEYGLLQVKPILLECRDGAETSTNTWGLADHLDPKLTDAFLRAFAIVLRRGARTHLSIWLKPLDLVRRSQIAQQIRQLGIVEHVSTHEWDEHDRLSNIGCWFATAPDVGAHGLTAMRQGAAVLAGPGTALPSGDFCAYESSESDLLAERVHHLMTSPERPRWASASRTRALGLIGSDEPLRRLAGSSMPQPISALDVREWPEIGIVVPTHNRRHLLERALDSIRAQTYPHHRTIVIDDASTDDTRAFLSQRLDPSLTHSRNHRARGPSGARNTALELLRTPLVAFLDSDDEWRPEKLERQVVAFQDAPSLGLVGSDFELIDHRGTNATSQQNSLSEFRLWSKDPVRRRVMDWDALVAIPALRSGREATLNQVLCGYVWLHTSNVVVRRSVFDEIHGFDESMRMNEDTKLWLSITSRFPAKVIDGVLSSYDVTGFIDSAGARYASYESQHRASQRDLCASYFQLFGWIRETILLSREQSLLLELRYAELHRWMSKLTMGRRDRWMSMYRARSRQLRSGYHVFGTLDFLRGPS